MGTDASTGVTGAVLGGMIGFLLGSGAGTAVGFGKGAIDGIRQIKIMRQSTCTRT